MSGIFSTPKPPPPDPELEAAQKRQEARIEADERQQKAQLAARRRARQVGGMRMLLSEERENARTGLSNVLGPS